MPTNEKKRSKADLIRMKCRRFENVDTVVKKLRERVKGTIIVVQDWIGTEKKNSKVIIGKPNKTRNVPKSQDFIQRNKLLARSYSRKKNEGKSEEVKSKKDESGVWVPTFAVTSLQDPPKNLVKSQQQQLATYARSETSSDALQGRDIKDLFQMQESINEDLSTNFENSVNYVQSLLSLDRNGLAIIEKPPVRDTMNLFQPGAKEMGDLGQQDDKVDKGGVSSVLNRYIYGMGRGEGSNIAMAKKQDDEGRKDKKRKPITEKKMARLLQDPANLADVVKTFLSKFAELEFSGKHSSSSSESQGDLAS